MSQIFSSVTPSGPADSGAPPGASPVAPAPSAGSPSQAGLAQALTQLEAAARELEGQPEALLGLLRSLEQLHRSIQDGPFRASLPADRNDLFRLLSEMERSGGWPYIPRLQLRTFLDLLSSGAGGEGLPETGEAPQDRLGAEPPLAA